MKTPRVKFVIAEHCGAEGPRGPLSGLLPEARSAGAGCAGLCLRLQGWGGCSLRLRAALPVLDHCHGESFILHKMFPCSSLCPLPLAFPLCFGACLSE